MHVRSRHKSACKCTWHQTNSLRRGGGWKKQVSNAIPLCLTFPVHLSLIPNVISKMTSQACTTALQQETSCAGLAVDCPPKQHRSTYNKGCMVLPPKLHRSTYNKKMQGTAGLLSKVPHHSSTIFWNLFPNTLLCDEHLFVLVHNINQFPVA